MRKHDRRWIYFLERGFNPHATRIRDSFSFNFRFCCSDALATTLSALYGKLLVVMGIAFPMAEVISTYIPPSFYEAFYLYLYFGSMIFLVYMYAMLFRDGKTKPSKFRELISFSSLCLTKISDSQKISIKLLQANNKRYKQGVYSNLVKNSLTIP